MTAPPRLATPDEFDNLRDAAVYLLRQREAAYPRLIELGVAAGGMRANVAADKLELSRCLVAQWKWVCDPTRPPLPKLLMAEAPELRGYFGVWARELRTELDDMAAKARARATAAPDRPSLAEIADLCEALAWYQVGTRAEDSRVTDLVRQARLMAAEWRARNPVRHVAHAPGLRAA